MTPVRKVRRTFTIDEDILELLSADDPENLSAAVNEALRYAVERRRRERASIRELADSLDALYGPPDPDAVERALAYLS